MVDNLPLYYKLYFGFKNIIYMDNCNTYIAPQIKKAIIAYGYYIKYLPLYSPDLSLIELTFLLLKA